MKQIATHITRVWNHLQAQYENLVIKIKTQKNDDSIEAQTQTFRVWMWASAAGLSISLIASLTSIRPTTKDRDAGTLAAESTPSILDQLPDGYLIAPIEPSNIDSLDSIFDQHGYADLYRSDSTGGRGERIARGLALLRAPKNPRRFAVIVHESQMTLMANLNEPVMVVLRKGPPKLNEAHLSDSKKRHRQSPVSHEGSAELGVIEENLPESEPLATGVSS